MPPLKFVSYDWLLAGAASAAILVGLIVLKALAARQLLRLSSASRLQFLSYPEQLVKATRLPFMLGIALLGGISLMDLSPRHETWLHNASIVILISQVALWVNRVVTVAVQRAFERQRAANPAAATHLSLAGLGARIVIWTVAGLVMLDNLGFNITTLMASLGIGGIAVALALQTILGDIFSSVSIALDKPFAIGDFIVIDDYMGTVEYIGMKTTRLRSLGGEQIVISNTELLKNRIRNYKRMEERRIQFEFGIAYDTALEEVKAIPEMVRAIVTSLDCTRFDRAHFKGYGDSSLKFEVVYYVLDPDFNKYMDIQQAINHAMLEQFRERSIVFAYPTRTLYIVPPDITETAQAAKPGRPPQRAAA
jgi:small-conductance mechanosensitive channel